MSRITEPSPQEDHGAVKVETLFDPNTLWRSPYDTSVSDDTEQAAETTGGIIDNSMLSDDPIEIVNGVMLGMQTFWVKFGETFKDFWSKMRVESRENFLRAVYPTIVQSVEDRYCVLDGEKVYESMYDRFLLLVPHITVDGIKEENTLIDMLDYMAKPDGLFFMTREMTLQLRQMIAEDNFPLTEDEEDARDREVPVKKNAILVVNSPEQFGKFLEIKNPQMLEKDDNGELNLFEMGCICHQYEFNIMLETLHFAYTLLAAVLDDFHREVLAKHVKIVSKCSACGASGEEVALKQCAKCKDAVYCSRYEME